MNKIVGAIALAVAIPAAAYARGAPAPAAKGAQPQFGANMRGHAECMKMRRMMSGMMQGTGGHGGHPMMQYANGLAHHQMMRPDANAAAASQHQQHQR